MEDLGRFGLTGLIILFIAAAAVWAEYIKNQWRAHKRRKTLTANALPRCSARGAHQPDNVALLRAVRNRGRRPQ